jgi:ribose/xylose/arabinose/galactoside ABC-type transport system permease subunit
MHERSIPERGMRVPAFLQKNALFLFLIFLIIVFSIFSRDFFTFYNFINILKRISVTGIISLGTLFVIISGGIDVSVGALAALSTIITAAFANYNGSPVLLFLFVVFVALIFGFFQGITITKGKVPPIITTLATMTIVRGALMLYTKGFSINNPPHTLLKAVGRGKIAGIPVLVVIMFCLYIISWLILKKTKFGRYVYAIGGGEHICRLTGIKVDLIKIWVYVYASLMSFLGGFVLNTRLSVGQPTAATGLELECIAAVVLGGASLAGGEGTVQGTFLGVVILGLLVNGLNLLNVVTYWQYILQGIVILVSTLIYSKRI